MKVEKTYPTKEHLMALKKLLYETHERMGNPVFGRSLGNRRARLRNSKLDLNAIYKAD